MNSHNLSGPPINENLLICLKNNPLAKVKIICFPFAGGGASFFYKWIDKIHDSVEIYSIALPGRESRLKEMPFEHYEPLVHSLSKNIMRQLGDEELIFFGHSLGSIISFEVSHYLMEHYNKVPLRLFVSSCKAPRYFNNTEKLSNLTKLDLINKLKDINGTPHEILESEELLDFYLPIIKSDFKICDSYKYYHDNKILHCPITAIGGTKDNIKIEDLNNWSVETDELFEVQLFEGDHFYLVDNHKYIIESILKSIY
ncbi:thioesterase II family protein [Lysinibacillus sp. NPDC059133]|uniref:thioesterase II family protein n=1 Tax=Lysinibacillus sp. NPDC059133 TaxID=3346737 RepID=UPI0036B5C8BB